MIRCFTLKYKSWFFRCPFFFQWEHPPVEVIPLLPSLVSRSASVHPPLHPLPKVHTQTHKHTQRHTDTSKRQTNMVTHLQLSDSWIAPEEVGVFPRRETNQIIQRPRGHVPRTRLLLRPSQLLGETLPDTYRWDQMQPLDWLQWQNHNSGFCEDTHSSSPCIYQKQMLFSGNWIQS